MPAYVSPSPSCKAAAPLPLARCQGRSEVVPAGKDGMATIAIRSSRQTLCLVVTGASGRRSLLRPSQPNSFWRPIKSSSRKSLCPMMRSDEAGARWGVNVAQAGCLTAKFRMTLYHDPNTEGIGPTLIGDLLGIPATDKNHQLENQATTVLAWLIDRSPAIAKAVLELFLGDYASCLDPAVGARTQLTLPKPDGGALYPDLSLCVGDRTLQLLVEVKIDSGYAVYETFGGQLQPQVYRELWTTPTEGDARVRAVGTLTRVGGSTEPDPNRLFARDVTWRDLRNALDSLHTAGAIEPECRLVAESFVTAIDERISPAPLTRDAQQEFFHLHAPLLDGVKGEIARLVRGTGAPKRIDGKAYFGWRVPLPGATDAPLFLRLYLSPQGTRLNLPGHPDALIAAPERDTNGTLDPAETGSVQAAGFSRTRDLDKYWLYRRAWPLAGLEAEVVALEIVTMLAKTGLLLDGAVKPPRAS